MKTNIKRVISALLATLAILLCISMTVCAATPSLNVPDIPDFSNIKFDIKFDIPDDTFDDWFDEYPLPEIRIPKTKISTAKYVHGSYWYVKSRLEISWNKVEDATNYEVEIIKADGTIISYNTTKNTIYDKNAECTHVYIEETNTWESATVRVRAIIGDFKGNWSEPVEIGCNKLHNS